MMHPQLAVIGGTGLYQMGLLTDVDDVTVETPYGPPSDTLRLGTLAGLRVVFLARHGRDHQLLPHEVPYRANIWALKSLGVSRVVAVSACGSMKEEYEPGHVVIPDQLFDRTRTRAGTFFGDGLAVHVGFAQPFCPSLSAHLAAAVRKDAGHVHAGGAYITIEGPRFSSRAESLVYRQWDMDVIGMTVCPEAQLAREAEMCYAVMAHVTDYDCWHEAEEAVSVELVLRILQRNAEVARDTIATLAERLSAEGPTEVCACQSALDGALLTPLHNVPAETRERLRPILARFL